MMILIFYYDAFNGLKLFKWLIEILIYDIVVKICVLRIFIIKN